MGKESTGCFAWCISFQQSCSERWARFRNRLRRRFYARKGQTLDPSTVENETGTMNIVIRKSSYKTNKVLPERFAAPPTDKECPVDEGSVPATEIDDIFEKLVGEYVSGIITRASDTLWVERQGLLGNERVILENSADNVSLSSSIISQMANVAVTKSLSNVLLESNINQSAVHKTIKDFMEVFGTVGREVDDDQLTVRL